MSEVMQVPAHIAQRMAARKQSNTRSAILDAMGGTGESLPRISIKAAKYRLVEGGVETPVGSTLDVVIVGMNPNTSKVFFDKAFDGTDQLPACASDDGVRPNASIASPIAPACATCPNNVLGSKINPSGAKSKLCADQRHLAVVAAADPSKVYQLTISVSAMKPLREYFKHLQNYGTVPEEVVTELGFDDNASFPLVTFKMKKYLPEKALDVIDTIVQSDEVKAAVHLPSANAAPAIPAPAAPAVAAPAPAPAPAPEPVAVVETPAPAPEPVVEAAPVVEAPAPAAPDSLSELESALDGLFD